MLFILFILFRTLASLCNFFELIEEGNAFNRLCLKKEEEEEENKLDSEKYL